MEPLSPFWKSGPHCPDPGVPEPWPRNVISTPGLAAPTVDFYFCRGCLRAVGGTGQPALRVQPGSLVQTHPSLNGLCDFLGWPWALSRVQTHLVWPTGMPHILMPSPGWRQSPPCPHYKSEATRRGWLASRLGTAAGLDRAVGRDRTPAAATPAGMTRCPAAHLADSVSRLAAAEGRDRGSAGFPGLLSRQAVMLFPDPGPACFPHRDGKELFSSDSKGCHGRP